MAETSFPKERIRFLLLEGVHDSAIETLAQAGYVNVIQRKEALSGHALLEALDGVHVLGLRSRTRVDAEVFARRPKLMAVGCFCIGTNQVAIDAARSHGVPVFNAPHSNTRSVAEMVIAEAVILLRRLGDKIMAAHAGRWHKSATGSHELRGKTLGIVGYGHIGSQVSVLAEALGMRVIFQDIVPCLSLGNALQVGTLDELLERSDVVTLHVPETPDTRGLIDRAKLAQMRRGACLINASRGTVVDIDALADALRDEHLAGAAVDVFPSEPKDGAEPFTSPLRGLPNVLLTPHVGGSTEEAQSNIGREVANKLIRYSDLGSTVGAVDFPSISLASQSNSHRVLHVHTNKPGVLGRINRALSEANANIVGQYLQTTADVGYVVTDINAAYPPQLIDALKQIEGTIRCRVLY